MPGRVRGKQPHVSGFDHLRGLLIRAEPRRRHRCRARAANPADTLPHVCGRVGVLVVAQEHAGVEREQRRRVVVDRERLVVDPHLLQGRGRPRTRGEQRRTAEGDAGGTQTGAAQERAARGRTCGRPDDRLSGERIAQELRALHHPKPTRRLPPRTGTSIRRSIPGITDLRTPQYFPVPTTRSVASVQWHDGITVSRARSAKGRPRGSRQLHRRHAGSRPATGAPTTW